MDEFHMVLANNGLFDVKPARGWFTWANHVIKKRIDRFDASQSWLQAFPNGKDLFASASNVSDDFVIDAIDTVITDEMNGALCADFTTDEIIAAFRDIHPRKAHGIDGLPASFYRLHWDIVGADVVHLCLQLLQGTLDMSLVNKTVIVLIPKMFDPQQMKHLRPISLCTVVYKIVSKVLVRRLKGLMASCIHETQAVFLPGRQISDNILVAHELIHYMNSSKNGPNKGAAIKLDMEKAYDRVEWSFLRKVMLKLGFCADWVNLIMRCVETVSFSVRINGSLTKEFSLIFIKNSLHEASNIRDALGAYEVASGQKVNLEKSTLYFSPSTRQECRDQISSILGIGEVSDLGHYLGMPLHIGKNKTNTFGYLKENVSNRIDGWTKHLLSFGGHEDLVSNMRRYWWLFSKEDAMQILSIPIAPCAEDVVISGYRNDIMIMR
ncbi:hypothetical protein F3Y22_tig00111877pilonHSYRG00313 [Hibiscus syriacus]|uniref:Reverse transcriptase domain-containing protein n=1 Tax=Hibiscus syriacus TaxID=106335 RepID=A0A6A2X9N3_HIBSY|nr:hypothetical protein F3Y22_tig00111877pilonHSYRG00313 [Hibiscus syriacus]